MGYLLKKLSSVRKKEELNKIFASVNKEKSRRLITDYGLDKYLGINNIKDIIKEVKENILLKLSELVGI